MKNYYEVLGVPENATLKEIRKKYLELAKVYHPDKHQNNPLKHLAEERFMEIKEAYEILVERHRADENNYEGQRESGYTGAANGYREENEYRENGYGEGYSAGKETEDSEDEYTGTEELLKKMRKAHAAGQWRKAIIYATRIIDSGELEPEDMFWIYGMRGACYVELDEYKKGADDLIHLCKNSEADSNIVGICAFSCRMAGYYREAVKWYRKYMDLAGEDTDTFVRMAECCDIMGDKKEAGKYWTEVKNRDPSDPRLLERYDLREIIMPGYYIPRKSAPQIFGFIGALIVLFFVKLFVWGLLVVFIIKEFFDYYYW